MMRSLELRTGFKWTINDNSLKALRNTFSELNLTVCEEKVNSEYTDEYDGFDTIAEKIKDNSELFLYPSPANFISNRDKNLFPKVKSELKFKKNIFDKCKSFRDQFDGEVIGLHIRKGDFASIDSGMFLCGNDYYKNALGELPDNIPVLVFTNDKESVINDSELIASNPNRFTFITDLFNDNQFIDCVIGREMDRLVDISGDCKFDYKNALIEISKNRLNTSATHSEILKEVSNLIKELHPKYIQKLKTQSYNYSYDLCLMSMCDYFIMANSTLSLWGVELGNPKKVIYPKYWVQDYNYETFINKDLNGHDQVKDMIPQLIDKPHYTGIENPDPRSFTVISDIKQIEQSEHGHFYKALNAIPEELLSELYDSATYWLEVTRKTISEEVYPPETSYKLLSINEFVESELWTKFYAEIGKHVEKYCDETGIDLSTIKMHSSWVTRIADIDFLGSHEKEELMKKLEHHNPLGNMHSHTDNPIGIIYYLKNPDPKYGTVVKLSEDKIYNNTGEENSLMIFNPELYHTALYPPISISEKYPRITIIVDYCYN